MRRDADAAADVAGEDETSPWLTSNHAKLSLLTDDEDLVNDDPGSGAGNDDDDDDFSGDGGFRPGGATPVPPSDKYPGEWSERGLRKVAIMSKLSGKCKMQLSYSIMTDKNK